MKRQVVVRSTQLGLLAFRAALISAPASQASPAAASKKNCSQAKTGQCQKKVAGAAENLSLTQESACDLVPAGRSLKVRRDGSVYVKASHPYQPDSERFAPDVVMGDKVNAKAALQLATSNQDSIVAKYKQIDKELPRVHSPRTGLAGLNRNWQ